MLQQAYRDRVTTYATTSISLKDVVNHKPIREPLGVVDWTDTSDAKVKVQAIDAGTLFRADATYLFVGMAGELGQSLAGWMVSKGARYVVLTSRSPNVNPLFIEEMASRYGAVVQALSLDVTSRESLWSTHATIVATMPPIAGVINGAMILDDELFSNMSYEQFARVAKPKVLGTELLDELFYDDISLDFFIVASSIASIIGWSGQSNYSAANEFITSLVNQRQRRGVCGSAMNIPAVLGIGYAAHSTTFDFDYFQSLGYINISEHDLHILFAETVLAGRRGQIPGAKAQVAMGVDYITPDLVTNVAHRRDIKFAHFIKDKASETVVKTSSGSVSVKAQLQQALTPAERYVVITNAFLAHLRRMLRIPSEKPLQDSITLVELGVDSLVAVDIRAWFLKELDADIPTLKILGGGSVADMVNIVFEKLASIGTDTMDKSPKSLTPVNGSTTSASSQLSPPTFGTPRLLDDISDNGSASTEPLLGDSFENDINNGSVKESVFVE
jgi:hybrid polyketide synthase/nonribosomal peptide synthetase ACE1